MPRNGYRQLVGKIAGWRQEQHEQQVRDLEDELHTKQRATEVDLIDITSDTAEANRDAA